MTPTCPCCGSAKVWNFDSTFWDCKSCDCSWNEARRSQPEGCREAFEKEYPKHGGHYFSSSDRALMWGVWQAAWNARRSPDASEVERVAAEMEAQAGNWPDNEFQLRDWAERLKKALKDRRP